MVGQTCWLAVAENEPSTHTDQRKRLQMFRMKMLAAALFGVAILSTALTSTATPALALGGCGPNAHRGFWGG